MKVTKISAITIFTEHMKKSCMFYSSIPKSELSYGGPNSNFTTIKISESPDMFLNIEKISSKQKADGLLNARLLNHDSCRIIFHTDDVDASYQYLKNDDIVSKLGKFETVPTNADWGERYFQVRDPDGYPIVCATPIT